MPNAERGPVARIGTLLLALIATGVAAEAALVPITLDHFGCNGAYGILANVVAIPLSSFVIMPAMILALLLEPVGLADSCYTVLRLSLDLLITMSLEVQRWPGAVIRAPAFPTSATPLFVFGGLWLLLWRTRMRWFGLAPLGTAAALMIAAAPADLLVSKDGRHAAVRLDDGQLAMLRPRAERFVGTCGATRRRHPPPYGSPIALRPAHATSASAGWSVAADPRRSSRPDHAASSNGR